MRIGIRILLLLSITTSTVAAKAVAHPLSASVLVEHCRVYSPNAASASAKLCEAYLDGFVGALRTSGLISSDPRARSADDFTERAWRTRLGKSSRIRDPDYCLPTDTQTNELVAHLLAYVDTRGPRSESTAARVLAEILRIHYSCRR